MKAPEVIKADLKPEVNKPRFNLTEEQKVNMEAQKLLIQTQMADQHMKMVQNRIDQLTKRHEAELARLNDELKVQQDRVTEIEKKATSEAVKTKLTGMKDRASKQKVNDTVTMESRRNLMRSGRRVTR